MPKITFDSQDAIPEGLREEAKQDGEKFTVNVVLKSKLDEFRDNNVQKSEELEALQGRMATLQKAIGEDTDLDEFVEQYPEMLKTVQRVKDGELSESEDIEAEVQKRTKQMRTNFETQLSEAEKKRADADARAKDADKRFRQSTVDNAIAAAVHNEESGANPEALRYIQMEARDVFQVGEDGKLVPKNGEATIYGEDGTTPMTPVEWVQEQAKNNTLFAKRSGGGGGGHGKEGRHGFSDEEWNKLSPAQKLRYANGDA